MKLYRNVTWYVYEQTQFRNSKTAVIVILTERKFNIDPIGKYVYWIKPNATIWICYKAMFHLSLEFWNGSPLPWKH